MKYIYITPFVKEDFFEDVKRGMNDAAAMLGVQAEFTGTEGDDYQGAVKLIEDAVANGYDGIAANLTHPTAFKEVLERAAKEGIPVVAFNIDSPGNKRLSAVCQNFLAAGRGLGNRVLPYIDQGAEVLLTMHDEGVSALEERLQGIEEALRPKSIKAHTIISQNTPQLALDSILTALERHPGVSAIIGTGQSDTHGAGAAAKKLEGKRKLLVAGFDTCPEILSMIRDNTIYCTVDQQPYVQGFYPVLMMHQHKALGVTPFDIDTGSAIIDSTNVR